MENVLSRGRTGTGRSGWGSRDREGGMSLDLGSLDVEPSLILVQGLGFNIPGTGNVIPV